MYRVGISTNGKEFTEKEFDELQKSGISDIEFSMTQDYDNVKKLSAKFGINIWSQHLPFGPFEELEISSFDKYLRKSTIEKFSEMIKKGANIGIDKFVVHPSGEPIEENDREERLKYSRESLSILADVCEKCGGVICVEDLPRTCLGRCISDMKFLTNEDNRIKICFDTNHITAEKPEDVIRALGDKIATLHVSDFDFVNERHWLPGEGKINWNNVVDALKEINYGGVWMYEIGFACPKTILRDRDLTPYDFKRNAAEVLNKEKITVFSTPKPNLGMWE